jgi:hypothetical protein
VKTIGIVAVAPFAVRAEAVSLMAIAATLTAHEIGRQGGKPIVLVIRPGIFNGDILTLDIAGFAEALPGRQRQDIRTMSVNGR